MRTAERGGPYVVFACRVHHQLDAGEVAIVAPLAGVRLSSCTP